MSDMILHHYSEQARAARGNERLGREQRLHAAQRVGNGFPEAGGAGRQLHPRADLDKQLIVEERSQALQGIAGSWLRASDPPGCSSDVHFRDQRVQRDQQIQVDGGEIHGVNFENRINRLDESLRQR
jgi:hypothetical protein